MRKKLRPKLVVLFGSAAKGNFGVGSDIDILIVSDMLPKNFQERSKLLFLLNDTFAPIEPIGYTSREFKEMVLKRHSTALEAITNGSMLHEEKEYGEEIRSLFEKVAATVKKEEFGWIKTTHESAGK
ncbi:MAG: nucleotidyltransferase domain-containing protein [Candidatus Brockarchaeota archaeon]|nr:nucleotidyltransferase domain-containing protein [Candidatus Brockarchaeota archaeon]